MIPARIFLILFLLLAAARADAANVEALVGGGTASSEDSSADFFQVRVRAVHALLARLDAFAGLEYTQSEETDGDDYYYSSSNDVRFSFYYPAAALGLRFKPVVRDKIQLYLALGAVAGRVYYETDFSHSHLTLLSEDKDSAYFIVPRFEMGLNHRISERTTLIAQGGATGALPAFNAVAANKKTGVIEDVTVNNRGYMFGFMLGVRYKY
ncbi:MAG: hypothetical protein A2078_13045 [Nitrospirae bacterium GWC2_57_9]|nr:MAG: hypothetical protein A2078_13045 [Nitrospirae bacterium GWC2_57_9]